MKHHETRRPNHLHLGPPLADVAAGEKSCCIDAENDLAWFEQNPSRTVRERPATASELQSTGYPPGTRVLVVRGPYGTQLRCFL